MFFILSKTISVLLMPIFWVLALFVWAFWTKNPKRKRRLFRLTFLLLILLSNTFIINALLLWWEVKPMAYQDLKGDYEVGIVLTGISNTSKLPKDRIYLDLGADRIVHALQLYRLGKIKKILITGGNVDIFGNTKKSEASNLAELLHLANVPTNDIIIEEKAKNTKENALFSQAILEKSFPNKKYLLITSAFHMNRAKGCFQKVGLQVDTFSAGVHTYDWQYAGFHSFIPSEKSFYLWHIFIHEVLGYVVYGLVGYL